MTSIFKKALFCVALAASSGAFAGGGGPLDGAYSCHVAGMGSISFDAYFAVVTNAQGLSAIAPVSADFITSVSGYGMGTATTTSFIGETIFGLPLALVVNPQTLSLAGTMGLRVGSIPTAASLNCNKIF